MLHFFFTSIPPRCEGIGLHRVDAWPVKSAKYVGSHPKIPPVDLLSSLDLLAEIWHQVTALAPEVPNCEAPRGFSGAASLGC